MPGNEPVAVAHPSLFLFDDDDGDGFGDFTFAPSVNSHPLQHDDDEWGDFVASPVGSQAVDPPHTDPAASAARGGGIKPWERPRGALPLSLFGDEEEPEPERGAPDLFFTNGFSFPNPKHGREASGLGVKGDLKDLIVNLYGNGAVPSPDPDAGVKKEGNGLDVSGSEKNAAYVNGNGVEAVGDRLGESREATFQHRAGNATEDLFDAHEHVTHNGSNGFTFNPAIGYEQYVSQTNLQTQYIDQGNVLQPTLETGDETDDDSCWEFKDAFSEVEDKIPNREEEEPTTIIEIQGTTNVWDNNPGDLSVPSESNKKEDHVELSVENNGPSCDLTYLRTETKDFPSGGGIVLDDIFSSLYDKVDQVYNVHPALNSSDDEQRSAKLDLVYNVHLALNSSVDQVYNVHPALNSLDDEQKSAKLESDSVVVLDDSEFDEIQWEFQEASVTKNGDQDSALRLDQSVSVELAGNTFHPALNSSDDEQKSAKLDLVYNVHPALNSSVDQVYNVHPALNSLDDEQKSAKLESDSVVVLDDSEFDEIQWEFQEASVTKIGNQDSALRLDQSVSVELAGNTFLNLYCRLREESFFFIVHHLNDLKGADIASEQDKVMEKNEIIQVAYKTIQEAMISEDGYMGKHPSRDVCVTQLLEVMKEPHFQAFEQEYCLHDRILSAGKDLRAAIELFEHTITVLKILGSASKEEMSIYVNAWSQMALACSQELQHGAMIWAESLSANVCREILLQGNQYFIALGEIFRVSELLRASVKLYKPWLLLGHGDSSEMLLTCLEKCAEMWTISGLEKALESICSTTTPESESIVRPLLESIKRIHALNEFSTQFNTSGHICNLSLLPTGVLQDMGVIVWNGEQYYTKLANLWANRVSHHPPKLPHMCIS